MSRRKIDEVQTTNEEIQNGERFFLRNIIFSMFFKQSAQLTSHELNNEFTLLSLFLMAMYYLHTMKYVVNHNINLENADNTLSA